METKTKLSDEEYALQFIKSDPQDIIRNAKAIHEGEILRLIQTARDRKEAAEHDLVDAVRQARAEGVTWQAIGGLLGMSRQGAQSFYAERIA
ncbi:MULTISPECIES: hypothetical protein [Mobiluncus]|uniref:Uncharacterized protein n=1 Tax=Mobiluncus holmesii ATCC 35242 TaxID=887899 RepID=E6M2N0_9ACTO|nr:MULTISPECIES: hypothetical protein [Mobiluncus]EFU82216.1 hypothetical protein HMPREF0576_0585 [Mobiluncus holmesii ATCC 35242]MCV0000583.1 hypothetical protein [Mobiluncus curtisii]MCV0020990.1 hypothetical protein [Mobiluncus curtisii]NMW45835.1 hypothetical protein [Mobiluncus curtisii]NMW47800.1 hypothetical protein [Mobiluncus curtisii]